MEAALVILAVLPVLVVGLLMVAARWKAVRAMPLGWALAAAPGARMRANLTRLVAAADNREQITASAFVAGRVPGNVLSRRLR